KHLLRRCPQVAKFWRTHVVPSNSGGATMSDDRANYQAFRQRLDAVLRQIDPAALRAFLIAEGQWEQDAHTDAERAMWLMIATSPALAELRDQAREWLLAHGYAAEVGAIFGGRKVPDPGQRSSHGGTHSTSRQLGQQRPGKGKRPPTGRSGH